MYTRLQFHHIKVYIVYSIYIVYTLYMGIQCEKVPVFLCILPYMAYMQINNTIYYMCVYICCIYTHMCVCICNIYTIYYTICTI